MRILIVLLLLFSLTSCLSKTSKQCSNKYDASYKGHIKIGDPYSIKNVTYTPKIEQNYDEIGQASWYGDHFHCKKTANGEVFNKQQFSAAHRTLPLPSVVKVTNLSNGKSVNVIVNDRGPFAKMRIIDLSEKTAIALDMKHHGIATVRVQFLQKETNQLTSKIATNKKILYNTKVKCKEEIVIAIYKNQAPALTTLRKTAKYGKVYLIAKKNSYKVVLPIKNKINSKILLKKIKDMGYKNAKIHSY